MDIGGAVDLIDKMFPGLTVWHWRMIGAVFLVAVGLAIWRFVVVKLRGVNMSGALESAVHMRGKSALEAEDCTIDAHRAFDMDDEAKAKLKRVKITQPKSD